MQPTPVVHALSSEACVYDKSMQSLIGWIVTCMCLTVIPQIAGQGFVTRQQLRHGICTLHSCMVLMSPSHTICCYGTKLH